MKKKKERNPLKAIRIPMSTRGSQWFKDKTKYNRKRKHKENY